MFVREKYMPVQKSVHLHIKTSRAYRKNKFRWGGQPSPCCSARPSFSSWRGWPWRRRRKSLPAIWRLDCPLIHSFLWSSHNICCSTRASWPIHQRRHGAVGEEGQSQAEDFASEPAAFASANAHASVWLISHRADSRHWVGDLTISETVRQVLRGWPGVGAGAGGGRLRWS